MRVSKRDLIDFETEVKRMWESGLIKRPIHLSGGNEDELLDIFTKVKEGDYVFSTHRNHYHALLTGLHPIEILDRIKRGVGGSMSLTSPRHRFFSSAIVGGNFAIATGTALGIKRRASKEHVWCFTGDAGIDQGHYFEAVRYAIGYDLPVTFVVEDNDRSVESSVYDRWGPYDCIEQLARCGKVLYYKYKPSLPHVGSGVKVEF